MAHYRVFAFYDYPPIQRSAVVEADTEERALLRAFLEGRIPACYRRGPSGGLQPVYWHPAMGGASRWPRLEKARTLVWGPVDRPQRLRFDIELEHNADGDHGPGQLPY